MATDNRTTLNDCSATTGWTGDDAVTVDSTTGQSYEGGSSLSWQATNAVRHMYTTSIGGTRDLSNAQVWMLMKDNLIQTQANNGALLVIGDGTNRIGYRVGGYDAVGLPLPTFFNSYRLDVTNKPAFNTFAGSEASLDEANITSAGIGTLHLAKAVGAIDNTWVDRLSFLVNGNYAMTINGGTVGTPETFADVVADDVTGGWGLINNPVGKQYAIFGSTEWGTPSGTADSYFDDSDFQLYLLGFQLGTGNFIFRSIGNATGTNSLVLTNGVIVNVDTRAILNFTNEDVDILKFTSITFTDCGAITFPTAVVNDRFVNNCIFNNCDQVDLSTIHADTITFNGTTDANGALLLDTNGQTTNQPNFTFNSDGSGHAVYITQPGTYSFDNWTFNGYGADGTTDAAVYNNSGGAVTINVSGGGGITVRNGAGASTSVVLDPVTFTTTVIDNDTKSPIQGAYVLSWCSGTGPYPSSDSVSITRSGSVATVTHTGHGLSTNDEVLIDGADQYEYNGVHTITVTGTNSYTFTVSGTPTTPATGTIVSSLVLLNGLTDVNGQISDTRTYTSDQDVTGWARKGTASPVYEEGSIAGTVDSAAGLGVNVSLNRDE